MKLYYNKKEYTSVDELSRIFTNDYRVKITPHNVYQICCHYHLTPLYGKFDEYSKRVVPCERKDEELAFFNDKLVWQVRHMKEDFTDVLDYVVNGDKYDAEWKSEPLTDYTPNESNMEYVNNELMNKYQFEGVRRIIKLTENQFNRLFEGVYINNLKNGKANITYQKGKNENSGNQIKTDYLKTDKMDENNADTYIVPLKGGIVSYNITSIKGSEVMHYFKKRWDNKKAEINIATSISNNKNGNNDKLTILWVDDARNPDKYFSNVSTSKAYIRNISYYEKIFENYNVDFYWVKNIDEFQTYILNNGLPDMCSFDFDLKDLRNDGSHQKGKDCAEWLKQYCASNNLQLPKCYLHSANHGGRKELYDILGDVVIDSENDNKHTYELTMLDDEFNKFKTQFLSKVSKVVEYALGKMNLENIEKLSIYPVKSSSRFNSQMCKEIAKDNICGLPLNIVDDNILTKDLRNIEMDNEFIGKNKEFYDQRLLKGGTNKSSALDYTQSFINKFVSISSTNELLNQLNDAYHRLIVCINNNKTNIRNNGTLTERQIETMTRIYMVYYDAYAQLKYGAYKFMDLTNKNGFTKIQQKNLLEPLKYSKGPSISKRSDFVWNIVKSRVRGLKSSVTNKAYEKIDICEWQRPQFEIKSISNAQRMGVRNIYNPTTDTELLNNEIAKIGNDVLIVFDDNLSGGATLSDVCYQFKKLGINNIIPITFGVMSKKESMGIVPLNKPRDKHGMEGFNY